MNENISESDYNRRDFLKGGSLATLMTMLGGVRLFADTGDAHEGATKFTGKKLEIGVIGLGPWGREILDSLALVEEANIAALCDNYPAYLRRAGKMAPKATQTPDYKTILDNKDISAVIVATPTYLHKDIVLDALKAGKHVYCEAPLATSLEDTRTIALAAKKAKRSLFQAGFQSRSDPERYFLLSFIRSGALGTYAMARAQWHKKTSWHVSAPTQEREKDANWRLHSETSIGLAGELGCHQFDGATWYLAAKPTAINGYGTIARWKDGRDVPDTVQAIIEYPAGINFVYDATIANSFDSNYEIFYGSDAAVMLRDGQAWMFKEVDSPLLGWEVYAKKDQFYEETGIVLRANASKSVQKPLSEMTKEERIKQTALYSALRNFSLNGIMIRDKIASTIENLGDDDATVNDEVATLKYWPAAGYLEGYEATVTAIMANQAITERKRIELSPNLYELT